MWDLRVQRMVFTGNEIPLVGSGRQGHCKSEG